MRRPPALLPVAALVLLTGCGSNIDPATTRINARVASPGGQIEAVSAEDMGGGATVASTANVYLVRPSEFPRATDRVFSKQGACEVWVRWTGEQTLVVSFAGRDDSFQTGKSAASPAAKVQIEPRGRDEAAGC